MSAQRASQLVEAGLWLRLSGDHEGARRLFEQALKLDPTNTRARQLLESQPKPASSSSSPPPNAPPAVQPSAPPPISHANPFQRTSTPPPRGAADLDWGLATGYAPTPPPIAPVIPKTKAPPPAKPADPFTVRIGDTTEPGLPPFMRDEVTIDDPGERPGDEPMVPSSSTMAFGNDQFGVPPPASTAPSSNTLMFGGDDRAGPPPDLAPSSGTMVFSQNIGAPPPNVPPMSSGTMVFSQMSPPPPTGSPVPSSGTMVFSQMSPPPPAGSPVPSSGTMVFSQMSPPPPTGVPPPSSGTMVFSQMSPPPPAASPVPSSGTMVFSSSMNAPPAIEPVGSSTMVFAGQGSRAPSPPAIEPLGSGTMQFASGSTPGIEPLSPGTMSFGGSHSVPPAVPPLTPFGGREEEPQPLPVSSPPVPSAAKSSNTLEFNFDDMVNGPPSPPRSVPPPVPPEPFNAPQTAWDRSNPRIDISKIEEAGEGGGFDLISTTPAPLPKQRSREQLRDEVQTLLSGAKDLLDLDDHSGAMELIAKALELDPQDPDALRLKDRSEKTLQTMYESKLGDLNQLPRVKLKDDEIIWLNLDHRAGFVLAQIDGSVTFEDLFAVSGMSRLDTGRILAQLVEEGVITRGG